MALFQNSVLNKYLKTQDKTAIAKTYKKFTKYFHNPTIQQNIRESKEEQFQEGFLRELFVTVFGYTLNPNANYNLTTELKNEKGAKKADGAILLDNKALAVIELKGTKTKDLESIRQQAFDYKANQTGCIYVITSNFEKLRFYINNAVDFEEFNLFTLTESQFELLYLCLHRENLLSNIPLKIKEASIVEEEKITKKFYADYSLFKRELFRDLVKLNMKNEAFRDELNNEDTERASKNIKHTLFKKSQKLIDRFLFIFFAEDRGLLPPNSTVKILKQWDKLKDLDAYAPLYNRYKLYFNYLDTGRKGTDQRAEIFAYNGGLFKPDAILDSLLISDDLLFKHTKDLSNYDFESQVDVNILGHIFENSLNEIESVNAEIEGAEFDKQKTKRKKDGVFYTPKYITNYIVENTIGKLCSEKKAELKITEERYADAKKRSKKGIKDLDEYREWLLQLTILDPACGSGAFLNQALDYLIKEHGYLDELQSKYHGGFAFPDIENTVLENNIYGVDINEESVEIAKLSLWLRTAQPRRKLNDLSSNIKCGNSLIDDPKVAGDKAFKWEEEFAHIFEKGGFDVVIGNPPYVRQELFTDSKNYLQNKYDVYHGLADLYVYFFEKGISLLKDNGLFSIIVANKWLKVTYGGALREWLKRHYIEEIIDFGDLPVFADATAYPCIITLSNQKASNNFYATLPENLKFSALDDYVNANKFQINQKLLESEGWNLVDERKTKLLNKINEKGISLHEYTGGIIRRGVVTGFNDAFVIDEKIKNELIEEHKSSEELIKPFLAGKDVKKYHINFENRYLIFSRRGVDIEKYPAIHMYLEKFRENLEPKPKDWKGDWSGRKLGKYQWYEIQDSTEYYLEFDKPKIIYPNICKGPEFTYDEEKYFSNQKCFIIPKDDKYLLGILNSKVFAFLFNMILPKLRGGYFEPGYTYLRNFPIVSSDVDDVLNKEITERVTLQLDQNNQLQIIYSKFTNYLQSQFTIEKLPRKLQNWHELEFGEFIKELNKAIKKVGGEKLTKIDEMEWMEVFETKKAEAQTLKDEIDRIDKEIDAMVYELYGLSEEEIKIVEGNS
jgi:type I restriction-modification system DNA methylase subunit